MIRRIIRTTPMRVMALVNATIVTFMRISPLASMIRLSNSVHTFLRPASLAPIPFIRIPQIALLKKYRRSGVVSRYLCDDSSLPKPRFLKVGTASSFTPFGLAHHQTPPVHQVFCFKGGLIKSTCTRASTTSKASEPLLTEVVLVHYVGRIDVSNVDKRCEHVFVFGIVKI
jgi:hypothetical protein